MTTDQNKAVMRIFLEKLDKDISAIDEFFIPDCIAYLPGFPTPTNREGFRQFVVMLYTAFPDLHHTMQDQIAENDKVANHVNVYGTHLGRLPRYSPYRKTVLAGQAVVYTLYALAIMLVVGWFGYRVTEKRILQY